MLFAGEAVGVLFMRSGDTCTHVLGMTRLSRLPRAYGFVAGHSSSRALLREEKCSTAGCLRWLKWVRMRRMAARARRRGAAVKCRRARAATGQQRALGTSRRQDKTIDKDARSSERSRTRSERQTDRRSARALLVSWARGGLGRTAELRQLETLDRPGCQSRQFVNSGVEVARATRPNRNRS